MLFYCCNVIKTIIREWQASTLPLNYTFSPYHGGLRNCLLPTCILWATPSHLTTLCFSKSVLFLSWFNYSQVSERYRYRSKLQLKQQVFPHRETMLISISIRNWLHLVLHPSIEFILSHNEEWHIAQTLYWLQGYKHEQNRHSLCASLAHSLQELCVVQWDWCPRSHSQNTRGTAWRALPLFWLYLTDVQGTRISWVAVLSSEDHHKIQVLVHVSNTLISSYTKQPKWLYTGVYERVLSLFCHTPVFFSVLPEFYCIKSHPLVHILILIEALFQWAMFS